jgi:protein-tyrosine phosphatase
VGLFERLFGEMHTPDADGIRILDVPTAMNLRELGGYPTPDGPTRAHRFLRCGSTRCMGQRDRTKLKEYGLTHVLDLRGSGEGPELTCGFFRERGITWKNIALFGQNLSDPALMAAQGSLDYLAGSYLRMVGNHDVVREVMGFLADVPQDECVLFHCAAGMDRTGVTSMLLLGYAGVSRNDIIKDYLYSFAPVREVDGYVDEGRELRPDTDGRLSGRRNAIAGVYEAIVEAYGGVGPYLEACGMTPDELDRLRARLLA